MNDAGSKALKQDADGRYSTNNSNAKPVYEEARKQANTAPTNNSKAGMKNGGQFQSNAMMMMAPFPMNNGMQPMGMMTPMPMYQPVAVHTSNGLQMMQPGYYPQMGMNVQPVAYPMMGMQGYPTKPGGDSMASGNYAYMPNQYILGSKSASNYYSHNNFDPSSDPNNRHGLTEQGNFHVGSRLPQKGLGEYIPTKSAGDSDNKRKFTPYTINDYKSLSRTHKTKLGGLGANLNEDWEEKIKKNEKTKEFSNMIRGLNSDKISKQVVKPKVIEKTPTVRDKALAFARNVPKPKAKRNDEKGSQPNQNSVAERQIDDEINRMENDLEALERQHQFYQEKISKLKS